MCKSYHPLRRHPIASHLFTRSHKPAASYTLNQIHLLRGRLIVGSLLPPAPAGAASHGSTRTRTCIGTLAYECANYLCKPCTRSLTQIITQTVFTSPTLPRIPSSPTQAETLPCLSHPAQPCTSSLHTLTIARSIQHHFRVGFINGC